MRYARDDNPRDVIVRHWGIGRIIGWTDEHEAELRRGWALRVRLAELAQQADRDYAALVADCAPALADATAAAEAAWERYDRLCTARRHDAAATPAAIAAAKAVFAAARDERRAAAAAAKKDPLHITRMTALRTAHDAAIAAATNDSGVYYDTASVIRQHHITAYQKVLADRARGRPAAMRTPEYDGGNFIVLIRGGGIALKKFWRLTR